MQHSLGNGDVHGSVVSLLLQHNVHVRDLTFITKDLKCSGSLLRRRIKFALMLMFKTKGDLLHFIVE